MRTRLRLFALAAAFALPAGLFAQTVVLKIGGKEEKWPLNDPFPATPAKNDPAKAVWKGSEITFEKSEGVSLTRRVSEIVRIEWPKGPGLIETARDQVRRGEFTAALNLIEPVLRHFDAVRKVPGSPWLKAADIKLDALSGLSNPGALSAFIAVLEDNDDGSVPGLSAKIKMAKLTRRVREGDHTAVLVEAERLLGELDEPDMQARLTITKADSLLATRKYEAALNTYLRVPVFFGAEKSFVPVAYLGAAKALRGLDTPMTRDQRLDLASAFYLREVIREFPVSKEAAEAKELLPREEREAEEKLAAESTEVKTASDAPAADAPAPAETPAPAAE